MSSLYFWVRRLRDAQRHLKHPQTLTTSKCPTSSKICPFRSCNVFTVMFLCNFKTRLKTLQLSSLYFWVSRLFFEFKTRHSNINPRYCIEWWRFHFSFGVPYVKFLCLLKIWHFEKKFHLKTPQMSSLYFWVRH